MPGMRPRRGAAERPWWVLPSVGAAAGTLVIVLAAQGSLGGARVRLPPGPSLSTAGGVVHRQPAGAGTGTVVPPSLPVVNQDDAPSTTTADSTPSGAGQGETPSGVYAPRTTVAEPGGVLPPPTTGAGDGGSVPSTDASGGSAPSGDSSGGSPATTPVTSTTTTTTPSHGDSGDQ